CSDCKKTICSDCSENYIVDSIYGSRNFDEKLEYCNKCYPRAKDRQKNFFNEYVAAAAAIKVSRYGNIKGQKVSKDLGEVSTSLWHNSVEDAKSELKYHAYKKGGQGIVDFWYEVHKEKETAGYSDNGNPYYKTVTYFSASANAVTLQEKNFKSNRFKTKKKKRAA
ncbi:MAG: hypothetical protein KC478_16665, partial [Bacteriovoracaceae bacterium]|nr:hypothetical protein [Bacteriovoracaceae bacterium]